MSTYNIYTDFTHFELESSNRGDQFELLRPFTGNSQKNKEKRQELEGFLKLVNRPEEADLAILPLSWNYYVLNDQVNKAETFIDICVKNNMSIWSSNKGDHGVKVAPYPNLTVFRQSGYASSKAEYEVGIPVFIEDSWVQLNGMRSAFYTIPHSIKPKVGFCGHSDATPRKIIREWTGALIANCLYQLQLRSIQAETVSSPTLLRAKFLKRLEKDARIETKFIRRKGNGMQQFPDSEKKKGLTTFLSNIAQNHYTLCLRGGGNFSVRFYETLAMGRIPLFVDTDCILPLNKYLEWDNHLVRITKNKTNNLEDELLQAHKQFSTENFREAQLKNRILWKEKLSLVGFFKTVLSTLF